MTIEPCVYCGEIAEVQDHVIPRSYLREINRSRRWDRFKTGDWLVPSCAECNSTLGSELLPSIPSRASFLLKKYKRKWNKVISYPIWSEEEINELSGSFKTTVQDLLNLKLFYLTRISHLERVSKLDEGHMAPDP